jgi:probable phosphoglycerate mutase
MKLILVRHGETEEEKAGIILGHLPGTLSASAREYIKTIVEFVTSRDLQPEVIIASDLARAADSAAMIGRALHVKIELWPLVRERKAGDAEGKTEDEINWKEYEKTAKPLRKHPNGESFEDVRYRAKEFLEKLKSIPYNTVILVSHSVFLATIGMEIDSWDLDRALKNNFREPMILEL